MSVEKLSRTMSAFAVPMHLRNGLASYILHGTEPGGFLRAVLHNNLRDAILRADKDSRAGLGELVIWLVSEAPERCWGSPERYHDWVAHNGQEGL